MVKILCALGALLSAFAGGWVLRIAPKDDPIVWFVAYSCLVARSPVFGLN